MTDSNQHSRAIHTMPVNDLVEHEDSPECICGPECEPVEREDGSFGWLYSHHSLDGRELYEVATDSTSLYRAGCSPAESMHRRGECRGVCSATGARQAQTVEPVASPDDPGGYKPSAWHLFWCAGCRFGLGWCVRRKARL